MIDKDTVQNQNDGSGQNRKNRAAFSLHALGHRFSKPHPDSERGEFDPGEEVLVIGDLAGTDTWVKRVRAILPKAHVAAVDAKRSAVPSWIILQDLFSVGSWLKFSGTNCWAGAGVHAHDGGIPAA